MNNLGFGIEMTAVGMALVFGVLLLLWGVLAMIGRIDRPQPVFEIAPAEPAIEPELLAAIAIAVMLHAASRRRQAAPEMRSTPPGSQIYASRWLAAGRTRQTRAWQPKR
jgi:Na+-transporting methylmalonyl-CoA/oxaloacetate decarboxylase gamma subunit